MPVAVCRRFERSRQTGSGVSLRAKEKEHELNELHELSRNYGDYNQTLYERTDKSGCRRTNRRSNKRSFDKRLYARFGKDGIDVTGATKNKRDHLTFSLYPKLAELFDNYTPCDPLIFVRGGQLWLSIPFDIPVVKQEGEEAVGIDLGMRRLFVTSDGTAFRDKDYLRKRRQVRYLKR